MRGKIFGFILLLTSVGLRAQISIVKLNLPENINFSTEYSIKPDFYRTDSAVFYAIEDKKPVKLVIKDSAGHLRPLKMELTLKPYCKDIITIEKHRRRLKIIGKKEVFFQPPRRCNGITDKATVERKIVDLMMIANDYPRMKETKKFIREHCLRFNQIQGLIMMFPSDKERLELAKYAYFFVRDPYNYFVMKKAFANNSTYKDFEFFVKKVNKKF